MEIARDTYLNQLKTYAWDGQVKVITGIRRCGKSYLLGQLYRKYLESSGVKPDNILNIALDLARDIRFRNPLELGEYVRTLVAPHESTEKFYLFIDEIQLSDTVPNPYNPDGKRLTFYDTLNDLRTLPNLDVYVTGSNSRMLSSDILTEFRGRSDEIRVHPLTFREYYSACAPETPADQAFQDYAFYGGMPLVTSRPDPESKAAYLESLFTEVYLRDIVERRGIAHEDALGAIVDLLCSSVGSLTNPTRVANALNSAQKRSRRETISQNTVRAYLGHLQDAFLFSECKRFDVRGKNYFSYPNKYYCEDVGLRNARLGFRQQEPGHLVENIIHNELRARRYQVDVGAIPLVERDSSGRQRNVTREIDFIATKGGQKIYLQSAWNMSEPSKAAAELKPLELTGDSFPKIVVRGDIGRPWRDGSGVAHVGIVDFLLGSEVS